MLPSRKGAAKASAVEDMLKKAVTTSDQFFQQRNAVQGVKDRKDAIRLERAEKKNTLSQWYGMKKAVLDKDQAQELELLQYRNFLRDDSKHIAPKRTGSAAQSEFVEFGYFADVGKAKRRRLRSFADEWVEENPEFLDVIQKRMKTNIKIQKKSKQHAAKAAARQATRERNKKESKRKKKGDML